MNKATINKCKQELEAMRDELAARSERTTQHLYRREEPYNADFAEQAVELENKEVIEYLDDEGKVTLHQINEALARIAAKQYGHCTQCGATINEERLISIPYTPFCISCAQKQ